MRTPRIACALVSLALVMAVGGCGADDDEAGAPAGGGACDDSDPMLFGQLAPLTGPSADLGALIRDGAAVGVEKVNSEGGVLGQCIEMIVKDDEGDPTKSSQAARELVDREEVVLVTGPVLSSPTASSLEVTSAVPVIQMVQSSLHAASIAEDYPYSFMDEFTQQQSAEAFVDYLQRQGLEHPVAMGVNNALGTYYADTLPDLFSEAGIEMAAPVVLFESGAVDLTPQMRPLIDAEPDVILTFLAAAPDSAAMVRARNQLSPDTPLVGTGALGNVISAGALTPDELTNVFAGPFPRSLTYTEGQDTAAGAQAQEFLELFREYRETPELTVVASQAMRAYDLILIAAAAIEATGSTDPDEIKEWLETNEVEGAGGTFRWTAESHAGQQMTDAVFIAAGGFQNGMLQIAPGEE